MGQMRAVKIDPWSKTVTAIMSEKGWPNAEVKEQLTTADGVKSTGMDYASLGQVLDVRATLWVDEWGLTIPGLPVSTLAGYRWPIAGMAMIVAYDEHGNNATVSLDLLKRIEAAVVFHDVETTGQMQGPAPDEKVTLHGVEMTAITPTAGPILRPRTPKE